MSLHIQSAMGETNSVEFTGLISCKVWLALWAAAGKHPAGYPHWALPIPGDPQIPTYTAPFLCPTRVLVMEDPKDQPSQFLWEVNASSRWFVFVCLFVVYIYMDTQPDFFGFYFPFQLQNWREDLVSSALSFTPLTLHTSYWSLVFILLRPLHSSYQREFKTVNQCLRQTVVFHYLWPLGHMLWRLRIMIQELNRVVPRCLEDHQKCRNMAFQRVIRK